MSERIQSAIITLDDGTLLTFTGKATLWPGDPRRVVAIRFTPPMVLPEGYSLEVIRSDDNAKETVSSR